MYSLLSASVLAIDLARHPRGVAVAHVVDRVLALTADDLTRLRGAGWPRRRARGQARVRARVLASCPDVARLHDLQGMLRREQPLADAYRAAVQVALDAVAAAWAGPTAEPADLRHLDGPWARALSSVPVSLPETPYREALRVLLEEVTRRDRQQWDLVVAAHAARRGQLRWSTLMHEACRAALEDGRERDVARAQLAAARALQLGGVGAGVHDEVQAVAMAVTAAVQAVCTGDLLDTSGLREAWLAAS